MNHERAHREPSSLPLRLQGLLAAGLVLALLMVLIAGLIVVANAPIADIGSPMHWFAISVLGGALLLCLLWLWLLRAFPACLARQAQLLADLQEHTVRLQETRRITAVGDWTWELDSGRVLWSDEVFRIHGLAPPPGGELRIEQIEGLMHPDDAARMQLDIEQSLDGTQMYESEYRIVRPDGEVRTVHVRGEWVDRTPGRRLARGVQQDVTELAGTRERLQAMQAEYRFLFEHNPLPMWVFDRDTLRFLAVNDTMLASYGYSRKELLGRGILDIRLPEDVAAVQAESQRDNAQRPQGKTWTHLCKDGSRLRAEIHTRDIVFDGRPARLVLAVDVTERERSEQRFQLVARATSDAVYDWDIGAGNLWWSESFYALFGHAHEAVLPTIQAWEALIHPDDLARVSASLQAALASGAHAWKEEYRFRRGDDSWAEVIDRGFLQRDAQGRVVRMVGGMLDVTERHREQVGLRLLRRAVEATDNGIVIADARQPDYPVVYVNHAFEEITGYAAEEVLGRNCRLLQQGDHDQPALEAIRQALREEREIRVLLRNYRKDGELFWNEFHLAPVPDEQGTLSHYVGVVADVSERQHYEEQLAYRATHDELTGLPNRQLLHDRLQQAILNAERYGRKVGVIFIDLDDFKLINDNLGHSAGDAALRMVTQRLLAVVRDTDTVGRFGGDEFVVVLTEQGDDSSIGLAIARITETLSQPMEITGVIHSLTPSIGWCHYPDAGSDAESLLMHADVAMYQAKQQGRNRAVAYRAAFDAGVSQRLQLISQLREALQREEFVLHFQPVFDLGSRPVALEALVRWQHPERGLLPPGEFISVCEESGLIVELGRRVIREAARHHRLLEDAGLVGLRIAVNVSTAQFVHDLAGDVEAALREYRLPRGTLEIEITESVIMQSPERAIAVMQGLAELGVSFTVDDFGTGYSSLSYLKRLPINRLKIDRSFVQDLASDPDDATICTAIIGLAHSLGLGTVAEGVETTQQLQWLRARGCDEIQGYLLGRPQPFETLLPVLLDSIARFDGSAAPAA